MKCDPERIDADTIRCKRPDCLRTHRTKTDPRSVSMLCRSAEAPHEQSVGAKLGLPGVGTWCKRILGWFKIEPEGCRCDKRAGVMDRNGIWWCIRNHREIVGWFAEEATRRKLRFCRSAGYAVLALAIVLALGSRLWGARKVGSRQ